jgi:succinoglycan biosynthesis transport protein ExoP
VVAIVTSVALLAALIYVLAAGKRYDASAQIVVTPIAAGDTTFLGVGGLLRDSTQAQPVVTAADLLDGPQVHQAAQSRLGKTLPGITVTPLGQSNVVEITANAGSAQSAADAANVYADAAIALRTTKLQAELKAAITNLQKRLAAPSPGGNATKSAVAGQLTQRIAQLNALVGSPDPTLSLQTRATPPSSASSPRTKLSLLVALLAGLVLGSALALLIDLVHPVVRDDEDVRRRTGLPVLARVPYVPDRELRRVISGTPDTSGAREAFRRLRSLVVGRNGSSGVIVVCSDGRQDGRTAVAIGLARALADAGRKVALVDGDMRVPSSTVVLDATSKVEDLPDLLRRKADSTPALQQLSSSNVWLLPASTAADGPDLLESDRLPALINGLRKQFDAVVVDAPPLGEGVDAQAFAALADSVLLCACVGTSDPRSLETLAERLRRLRIAPAGVVLVERQRRERAVVARSSALPAAVTARNAVTGNWRGLVSQAGSLSLFAARAAGERLRARGDNRR